MSIPKGNWQCLVGQQIDSVVVTTNAKAGCFHQVHLVFTDGSTFEIYAADGLGGSSRLYRGNLAEVLAGESEKTEVKVFSTQTAPRPEP